jgi:hypothetical protein
VNPYVECLERHESDEVFIEEIPKNTNSARAGVCGYCGTEEMMKFIGPLFMYSYYTQVFGARSILDLALLI